MLGAAACARVDSIRHALLRTPPYERYVESLRHAGIDKTPASAAWIAAGTRALEEPRDTTIPGRLVEQFRQDVPSALTYRIELRRGQVYRLTTQAREGTMPVLFVDLFRVSADRSLQRVASAGPPMRHLVFEPDEDEMFVIRVQPQLFVDAEVGVEHARHTALLFPVPGMARRNVQSLFGDSRSGGRREHQGIDIFAPRGTPVVAAADGWISSTSPNELGGTVVWLWDPSRGHTLYYAHLHRQAVSRGQRVRRGDVVGFVGNTGNARTTAPHLHFGIYRPVRGAIDPLYYVVDPPR